MAPRHNTPPARTGKSRANTTPQNHQLTGETGKLRQLLAQNGISGALERRANHRQPGEWRWRLNTLTVGERERLLEQWLALGADPRALEVIRDHAPDVLAALLQGASIPGSTGFSDRAVVMRMLGLGHLTRGGGPSPGETDRRIDKLGEALASRLAARAGHKSVAAPRVIDAEPQQDSDLATVTHKMPDLVHDQPAAAAPVEGADGLVWE